MKSKSITVKGTEITIISQNEEDYISLTDLLKAKDGEYFVHDWLKNRNTLEFLSVWEKLNNPTFNYVEFDTIKSVAGLNSFRISAKQWVEKTNAVGIIAKTGRYGGTYAHKDIALEFCSWISPEFKLYLIKEFQRLKEEESKTYNLDWQIRRTLTKLNYRIHTDAIKQNLIPPSIEKNQEKIIYANEADILNKAVFGMTAQEWRTKNPQTDGNIRDYAEIEQLIVLANIESINALLIQKGFSQNERLIELNKSAISQMTSLLKNPTVKKLK
jgi:KilA-N domain